MQTQLQSQSQTKTVAGRTWHFSHAIGNITVRGRGFFYPSAVTIAPGGILYVLNSRHRYQGYTAPISKLTIDEDYLGEFGGQDFTWPQGLAVDKDGNVYCSEGYDHFVAVYNSDGDRIGQWGEAGSKDGQFKAPAGLAFDSEDNLLVVDGLNGRVQKFTREGQFLSGWGSPGSNDGELNLPWGITIDQKGDVYVADWGNNRVQKFSPEGNFLMSFGSTIADGGQLDHPAGVAVDSEGDVYVTDWGNNRVQIYYPDGDIITGLYGDARKFSKWAQEFMDAAQDNQKAFQRLDPAEFVRVGYFRRPKGIAIDDEDRIVITDGISCRLQVYAKDKDYLPPQFNL